jgi:hypothetical protein
MRPLPLAAIGLLAAALLPAAPTYAAGETCQGRPATVVGTPGQGALTGGEGPDVVVTNGASTVRTLGGDDLVCVTGRSSSSEVDVDTGAGDDVVDASTIPPVVGPIPGAVQTGVRAALGPGRDRFVGGTGIDAVHTGVDPDADTVQMGGSAQSFVRSGGPGLPNPDSIVLGPQGGSVWWSGSIAGGARLDGGGGPSKLNLDLGTGRAVLDAAAGTFAEDGQVQAAWTGFDSFDIDRRATPAPVSFAFIGSDRAEQLSLALADAHTTDQDIDMGGGDDTLLLGYRNNVGAAGSTYRGGPGKDHVSAWTGHHLDLDLSSGRMVTKRSGALVRTRLSNFESTLVGAEKLHLEGTERAETLRFYACDVTVHAGGGVDDVSQSRGDDYFEAGLRCNPRRFRLYGDGGNDLLRGSTDDDVLVGGPGRDYVNGNGGRDRCSGERRVSCEVRLR